MTAERFITTPGDLTEREREVLALVAQGKTNAEIADALGIQFGTARNHVSAVLAKLGVATREEAAAWWQRERRRAPLRRLMRGLVPLPLLKVAAGVGAAAVVVAGGFGVLASTVGGEPEGATVLVIAQPYPPGEGVVSDRATAERWLGGLADCLKAEGLEVAGPVDTRRGQLLRFTAASELVAWDTYIDCAEELIPGGGDPIPAILPFLFIDEDTVPGDYRHDGPPRFERATSGQQAILADGEVTVAEHAAALDRLLTCVEEAGLVVDASRLDPADRHDPGYVVSIPDDERFDRQNRALQTCMASHYDAVWMLWQVQR